MLKQAGSKQRNPNQWKVLLGLGLAGPLVAGVALIPTGASGEDEAAAHDHAAHAEGLESELAQVRAATARFHRVEEAVEAGYQLGWVNGAGIRIVAGCVSHPTAGAMGYHYFNAELMADNDVNATEPEVLVYAPAPDGGLKPLQSSGSPKPAVQPSRSRDSAVGPWDGHAHSRATSRASLLPQACLGVGQQPGRDVRGLEPGDQLQLGARRTHPPGQRLTTRSPPRTALDGR